MKKFTLKILFSCTILLITSIICMEDSQESIIYKFGKLKIYDLNNGIENLINQNFKAVPSNGTYGKPDGIYDSLGKENQLRHFDLTSPSNPTILIQRKDNNTFNLLFVHSDYDIEEAMEKDARIAKMMDAQVKHKPDQEVAGFLYGNAPWVDKESVTPFVIDDQLKKQYKNELVDECIVTENNFECVHPLPLGIKLLKEGKLKELPFLNFLQNASQTDEELANSTENKNSWKVFSCKQDYFTKNSDLKKSLKNVMIVGLAEAGCGKIPPTLKELYTLNLEKLESYFIREN